MAAALLTINTEVPTADHPGTPSLVLYDNGDWEIAFAGDVSYIEETSKAFLGSEKVIHLLDELLLSYDQDPLDQTEDRAHLFVSIGITTGIADEAVVGFWQDGECEVMCRINAEKLVEIDDEFANFVPMVDMFDELRSFVSYHATDMFEGDDSYDIDDLDDEEGL